MSAWTDLGGGVHVRRSRLYDMNSVVAFAEGHALAIDAGVLPSELQEISTRVSDATPQLQRQALVFTHPHWDHVLARPWFPGATTVAHVGFGDELERDEADVERKAKRAIEEAGEAWPVPFRAFRPDLIVRGTARLAIGPFEAIAHEVPGHNGSQIALFFPAWGLFVAADTLSDIEIPWLDGPPWVYVRTLKSLHWVFEQEEVRVLVPGHGPIAYGRAAAYRRLLRDLDYLLHLEDRVSNAWKRGLSLDETSAELATMEYLGKDAAYPMNDVHTKNVRFAYEGMADMAADPGRS